MVTVTLDRLNVDVRVDRPDNIACGQTSLGGVAVGQQRLERGFQILPSGIARSGDRKEKTLN